MGLFLEIIVVDQDILTDPVFKKLGSGREIPLKPKNIDQRPLNTKLPKYFDFFSTNLFIYSIDEEFVWLSLIKLGLELVLLLNADQLFGEGWTWIQSILKDENRVQKHF